METRSQMKVAMTYGAILGLVNVIVYLVFYFMGADPQAKGSAYIGYGLMILTIMYGVKNYRDQDLGGFISYGRSLGTGVLIGLFNGIIIAIFTIIMFTIIDPDLLQKMMETSEQKLIEQGKSEEEIEMGMKVMKYVMKPVILFPIAVLGTVFWATLFSLLISIFVKNDKSPFENTSSGAI